jgi:hypothetical protein
MEEDERAYLVARLNLRVGAQAAIHSVTMPEPRGTRRKAEETKTTESTTFHLLNGIMLVLPYPEQHIMLLYINADVCG